jgi:hypothetical protein
MNGPPTQGHLDSVRAAIVLLDAARVKLREAHVRRAAILTAQALKAAQGAERAMQEQLNQPNGGK